MADELDRALAAAVERRLEREHDGEPVDPARDRAHAAAPPRPDLRADVVEDRNAGPLGGAREPQVELREVDQDAEVGRVLAQAAHEQAIDAEELADVARRFDDADRRDLGRVDHRLHPRGAEPGAADPEHLEPGDSRAQRAQEVGAVEVARRLARDHEHARGGRRRRWLAAHRGWPTSFPSDELRGACLRLDALPHDVRHLEGAEPVPAGHRRRLARTDRLDERADLVRKRVAVRHGELLHRERGASVGVRLAPADRAPDAGRSRSRSTRCPGRSGTSARA